MRYITSNACRGVAGRRSGKIDGVVIHSDAGSIHATPENYVNALSLMTVSQLAKGFAHIYLNADTVAYVEDLANEAWHTADTDGNAFYIGIEVCQSYGAIDEYFKKGEQVAFCEAAKILKANGLVPNRETVKLHKQFSATSCPHRSVELHGDWENCQDYFIEQIKKYYYGEQIVVENKKEVETLRIGDLVKTNGYCYANKETTKKEFLPPGNEVCKIIGVHGYRNPIVIKLKDGSWRWVQNSDIQLTKKSFGVGDVVEVKTIFTNDKAVNGKKVSNQYAEIVDDSSKQINKYKLAMDGKVIGYGRESELRALK